MHLETLLTTATDERLFAIAEAFRRGFLVKEVANLTRYDPWFLVKIKNIVQMEQRLANEELSASLLSEAKSLGFPDRTISELSGIPEREIRAKRKAAGVIPEYKIVDTCAAEFEAQTPYFYSSYEPRHSGIGSQSG
jgi:carbamoyl-phosphate synthase large subunit